VIEAPRFAMRSAFHIIAEALESTGLPRSRSRRSNTSMLGMPTPLMNTACASRLSARRATS